MAVLALREIYLMVLQMYGVLTMENWSNLTNNSHLVAYLINAYLKKEVRHMKSVVCADFDKLNTWHRRLLLLSFPLLPIFEL